MVLFILMGVVCLIEQEAQNISIIESTLKEINRDLEILTFKDLEGFHHWFSATINQAKVDTDPKANSKIKSNTIDLKLLIGDIQFLGPNYFSLIEKLRKLMVRRKLLKKEDDLSIVLTAFDSPDLNFKQIESRIITNIIFKPFDLPILKQQLKLALSGSEPNNDSTVYSQKIETSAEMLKEVQLESFTDLGFVTRSNRDLKINDVSKYYSHHFEVPAKSSVLARCISCLPHPEVPGEFRAEFRYIGVTNSQIRKLRQELFSIQHEQEGVVPISKETIPRAVKNNIVDESQCVNFLIFLKSSTDPSLELKDAIERNLANTAVTIQRNITQFLEGLEKHDVSVLGTKPIHGVILSAENVQTSQGVASWERVREQIEKFNKSLHVFPSRPIFILTSHNELSEVRLRILSNLMSDIIYTPIDRPYLYKRLVTLFQKVQPKQENIEVFSLKTDEIIRVANPIALTSVSEAHITMKYYRSISHHSFRRFCLPSINGEETLELLGSCFYCEKKEDHYINHFVFFGVTDRYLKYIRKWILERYIVNKDQKSA